MKEKDVIALLKPVFKARGFEYENLAGSRYQAGLPDWTCLAPDGRVFWLEFKASSRWSPSLLHGRQKLVLFRWATRGHQVFITGNGWLVDLTEYCQTNTETGVYRCLEAATVLDTIQKILSARNCRT